MTARTYMKNNIDSPYRKKLLSGLDTYLRRIKCVHFHEYKTAHLAQELPKLQQRKGIGTKSISVLRNQLRSDGYMEGHPTLLRTLWGRVTSLFKGRI